LALDRREFIQSPPLAARSDDIATSSR
jgi:hypothetical protein